MHWKDPPRLRDQDGIATIAFAALAPIIGAVGGALINKSATNKATDAATAATTANNALQREQYAQNSATLRPYIDAGVGATGALNRQLGISGGQGSAGQSGQGGQDWAAYLEANPDVAAEFQQEMQSGTLAGMGISTPEQFAQWHYQNYGQAEGRQAPETVQAQAQPAAPDGSSYGPQVGQRQTFTRTDAGPTPTFNRPTDTARPAYTRPTDAGFKFGMDEYVQTPGFNFQQERGMGALKSDKTFNGLLRSGAALKGALDFSQNLAMRDFTGERAFAYGQFSDDRNRQDNIFSQDRAYGTGAFEADRARQDGNFESDRGYGADMFLANRSRNDNIFSQDRAYGTGIYDADRGYATDRFDTRTNNLLSVSNQGLSGANALAGVSTNYVNGVSGNNNTQAGITANAALAGAGSTNALIGDAMYAFGRRGSSYGAQPNVLSGSGSYYAGYGGARG